MRVGLIGCGVMGSALARAIGKRVDWVFVGHRPEDGEPLVQELGGSVVESVAKLAEDAGLDLIVIAVKPKNLEEVSAELKRASKHTLVMSLLAGVRLGRLRSLLPGKPVCRILPNLPIEVGQGVVGIADDPELSEDHRSALNALLGPLGLVRYLSEDKLEALSALAGSGPGFVYMIIEAFAEAGISMGLKQKEAVELACQTLCGAAALCMETGGHPAQLKWDVAAPGGTTIGGLVEMEASGVRAGITRGILETRSLADR